jgi:hypothetical protein
MRNGLPGRNAYVIGGQPMFLFGCQGIKKLPDFWNQRVQFGYSFGREVEVFHAQKVDAVY